MIFGEHLRKVRDAHGVTLRELAEWMTEWGRPISYSTLAKLERGEPVKLTLDQALALARRFHASPIAWLVPEDGEAEITTAASFDGPRMLSWLRFGYSSAEGWSADLLAGLAPQLDRFRAALIAAKDSTGAQRKTKRDAAVNQLSSDVVRYLNRRRRVVEKPTRHYDWSGLPVTRLAKGIRGGRQKT